MNATQKTKPIVYDFLSPPTESGDLGTLGSYRIISELGKGGMGFVFRAEDIRLKRTVALKVMNKEDRGDTEQPQTFHRRSTRYGGRSPRQRGCHFRGR